MKRLVTAAIALFPLAVQAGEILFVEATPIREIDGGMPETLRDVLARLPEKDAAEARFDECPITWAHEASHFVNSRLSGTKHRAFYTLEGEAWRVPLTQKTTLEHVAASIPESMRGRTFKTYLVDSRKDWGSYPLYLFDELVAYQHGAMVRHELNWSKRRETEEFMGELAVYSAYMVDEVCRREGDEYPVGQLVEFYEVLLERCRYIAEDFDSLPIVKDCALLKVTNEEER
jgi:hypothetical protein